MALANKICGILTLALALLILVCGAVLLGLGLPNDKLIQAGIGGFLLLVSLFVLAGGITLIRSSRQGRGARSEASTASGMRGQLEDTNRIQQEGEVVRPIIARPVSTVLANPVASHNASATSIARPVAQAAGGTMQPPVGRPVASPLQEHPDMHDSSHDEDICIVFPVIVVERGESREDCPPSYDTAMRRTGTTPV
eukprot:scpid92631/ scgid9900/ 